MMDKTSYILMAVQWYFHQRWLLQHKATSLFELAIGAFGWFSTSGKLNLQSTVSLCVPLPLLYKKSTPCPKLKFVVLRFSHDAQLFVPTGNKRSARLEVPTAVLMKWQAFGTWSCDLGHTVPNILKEHRAFIFNIQQSQQSRQYAWTTGPWWWMNYAPLKCQELTTHAITQRPIAKDLNLQQQIRLF